jgi:hypothetical protein
VTKPHRILLHPLRLEARFALSKRSGGRGEQHDVVGEDAQDGLAALRLVVTCGQG